VRLSELGASFYGAEGGTRRGVGVTFWCPLCVKKDRERPAGSPAYQDAAVLPVAFANPLDGGPPVLSRWKDKNGAERVQVAWGRTGDTLETLTLSPSINAEGTMHGHGPGWHGHIEDGAVKGGGV